MSFGRISSFKKKKFDFSDCTLDPRFVALQVGDGLQILMIKGYFKINYMYH